VGVINRIENERSEKGRVTGSGLFFPSHTWPAPGQGWPSPLPSHTWPAPGQGAWGGLVFPSRRKTAVKLSYPTLIYCIYSKKFFQII